MVVFLFTVSITNISAERVKYGRGKNRRLGIPIVKKKKAGSEEIIS